MNTPRSAVARPASITLLTAAALAIVQQAGCASSGGGSAAAKPGATVSPAQAVNASADARFVDVSIASARWAVHMSDLVIANGERKEVKAVAMKIKQREAANLELLLAERRRLDVAAPMPDHHADAHMDADETRLANAKGDEADALYIEHMMQQRGDLIKLAEYAQSDLASPALAYFAKSVPEQRYKDLRELQGIQMAALSVPANARAGPRNQTSATTTPPRR